MDILHTLSGALTTDALIIFAVFFAVFFFCVRWGKSAGASLLLSLYIGILAFASFPYLKEATLLTSSEIQVTLSHIAVFVVGVAIIYSIVRYVVYTEYSGGKLARYFQAGVLSASVIALLFAFVYHTFPVSTLYDFNQSIDNLFISEYFFWWLTVPLLGLFVAVRR